MIIAGTAHSHSAGFYQNDDTPSGGAQAKADIQTCTHCQCVLFMHPVVGQVCWKDDGGWCGRCNKPICGPCADRMLTRGCEPFIKTLERQLEAAYRRRQFRALAGV